MSLEQEKKIYQAKLNRVKLLERIIANFEFISIIIFGFILSFGLLEFIISLFHFVETKLTSGVFEFNELIRGILSTCELFFISPILILIVASFKKFISKIYPLEIKMHPNEVKCLISENLAKKTFISSLIGITSTFLLGQFISIFSQFKSIDTINNFEFSLGFISILILSLLFLLILIFLYKFVSNHKEVD